MKKAFKILVIVLAVAFIAVQFFRPDRTDPPIIEGQALESSISVPPDVAAILDRSCIDCHTNKTNYPWYSNIAPVSWFLANHISEGRRHLNFSVWNTYENKKKARRLGDICEQVRSGEMPISSYLLIHRDAILKDGDVDTLCGWAEAERSKVPAS